MPKYNGYKSWDDYLLNVPSYPLLEYLEDSCLMGICSESRKLMLPKETVIKFHKRVLGKQSFCWGVFEKNYIWEYENYRLFVNKDGRNIETKTPNAKSVKESLNHYIKSIGITKSLEDLYFKNYKYSP